MHRWGSSTNESETKHVCAPRTVRLYMICRMHVDMDPERSFLTRVDSGIFSMCAVRSMNEHGA